MKTYMFAALLCLFAVASVECAKTDFKKSVPAEKPVEKVKTAVEPTAATKIEVASSAKGTEVVLPTQGEMTLIGKAGSYAKEVWNWANENPYQAAAALTTIAVVTGVVLSLVMAPGAAAVIQQAAPEIIKADPKLAAAWLAERALQIASGIAKPVPFMPEWASAPVGH